MTGGSYGGQIQFATAGFEKAAGTEPARRDHPADHLERPVLLAGPGEQHAARRAPRAAARSAPPGPGSSSTSGRRCSPPSASATALTDITALADPTRAQNYVTNNCVNFEPQVCQALLEVSTLGYPSQASIAFLRSNSVASYMRDVRVPTLIGQGQADTLFNLQESVATYTALKRQGTPVSLVWQSWGHSNSTPQPGELDVRHPAQSLAGPRGAGLVRLLRPRPRHPSRRRASPYYRDWVFEATGDIYQAYATAPSYPVGTQRTFYLSGTSAAGTDGALVTSRLQVVRRHERLQRAWRRSARTSRRCRGSTRAGRSPIPPGTAIRFATPALTRPMDVVGSPRLTVQLTAPTSPRPRRAARPGSSWSSPSSTTSARTASDRAAEPADLAGPRHRRHEADHDRAAGDRAPLRGGAPAGRRPRRWRPGLPRVERAAAGDADHRGPGLTQQLTLPVTG